ncbi:hypothetical protein D0Y65_039431 [Glycine soja]|uniref:Uncharacterized protein n=1 Tax=Glycine soja TaxID=3848 RepID=A0A445H950_GLYSO|nr:hypothetical protein D0Y65_039431 [Glycine soja]
MYRFLLLLPAAGAGLTGSKMARRVGGVDEFEFKAIGENHNQGRLGVEILVSGFVFEKEDFIRPWEGQNDNLERYNSEHFPSIILVPLVKEGGFT